jgi:translation initiation factor 3 subunit E
MQEHHGVGPEQIEALYNYGKMVYDSGEYVSARELLHQYSTYSMDARRILSANWGKLACEILLQDV